MTLDDNQKLGKLVLAARRIDRVIQEFDADLSPTVRELLREAVDIMNRDFQKAVRRLALPRKRSLKVAPDKVAPDKGKEEAS